VFESWVMPVLPYRLEIITRKFANKLKTTQRAMYRTMIGGITSSTS